MDTLGKIALFFSGVIVCKLVQKIFKPVELPAKILDIQIGWGKATVTYKLPDGEVFTAKFPEKYILERNIETEDIAILKIGPLSIQIIGILREL
ncbi:MAG: hypothetical protein Q4A21_00080 [bacterium]|nr:hypothetical protein [bacterium]